MALEYSFVPVILGVLTMVIGPLLGVYNFLKPQPLTSYGRGFEQNIHSNIRSLLGAIALALFLTVILGWNAYGENGNAIEIMMVEVNGLAIFVGTELGEAAGSLGVALNQTNYINTEYQDYPNLGSKQGFYRNEDCPSSVADDACTAYLTANPVAVPMYLEQTLPYRYGGPPGALKGDPSFCPKPAGKSSRNGDNSWTTAEISNYQMCILNLKAFYGMGHAFAGYPGEGRVFDPDPATDSNGDFILDGNGATTFAKPYLVSTEITDLLDLLDSEAKNSDSYAELGKQMIESMMRMRQILVYFMMQVRQRAAKPPPLVRTPLSPSPLSNARFALAGCAHCVRHVRRGRIQVESEAHPFRRMVRAHRTGHRVVQLLHQQAHRRHGRGNRDYSDWGQRRYGQFDRGGEEDAAHADSRVLQAARGRQRHVRL